MQFDEETPLEDVLKHIQMETAAADGKPIPFNWVRSLSTSMETLCSTVRASTLTAFRCERA